MCTGQGDESMQILHDKLLCYDVPHEIADWPFLTLACVAFFKNGFHRTGVLLHVPSMPARVMTIKLPSS